MSDMRYRQAAALLPACWRAAADTVAAAQQSRAEELRLRVGQAMTILLPEGEQTVPCDRAVTQADLVQLCDTVTGYSPYAYDESIRQGYLTAEGGFRIGLCGRAVVRNGENTTLREYSSAVIRIARQRVGLAEPLIEALLQEGRFVSTLIAAPPGLGKTTLLRDLVRLLSDGVSGAKPHRVALSDERGEIAAMYRGQPQLDVGSHTDVLDACPKALAIPMLLRAANPQVIAVDEITASGDTEVMEQAAHCGVALLATIHAADRSEAEEKPLLRPLL